MSRAGSAETFLLAYLSSRAGDGGDGFGDGTGVAEAALFVALVDDAAVEDVNAGLGGEGSGG
jgi:hypothetical protein